MKKNSPIFEGFLYFILAVKVAFLISILLIIKGKIDGDKDEIHKYTLLKDRLHHLFTVCMGILLIILFYPDKTILEVCVDGHTKLFLYIFGILSVLGIMQNFFHEVQQKSKEIS